MGRAIWIGVIDLLILVILFPALKEILDELQIVMESIINTPLDPFSSVIFNSLPMVFIFATIFWAGMRIFKRKKGGMKF